MHLENHTKLIRPLQTSGTTCMTTLKFEPIKITQIAHVCMVSYGLSQNKKKTHLDFCAKVYGVSLDFFSHNCLKFSVLYSMIVHPTT